MNTKQWNKAKEVLKYAQDVQELVRSEKWNVVYAYDMIYSNHCIGIIRSIDTLFEVENATLFRTKEQRIQDFIESLEKAIPSTPLDHPEPLED